MEETPTIVAGGGSLGLLLAGKLSAAGCAAEVWTRSAGQAERLRREGIAIVAGEGGAMSTAAVRAAPLDEASAPAGAIVLLAVKQTALKPPLLDQLRRALAPGCTLIAFCNGIGHFDKLRAALPGVGLAAAITTEGALRRDPATVVHTGSGGIWLGRAPLFAELPPRYAELPNMHRMQVAENRLHQAGFSVSMSNDMIERTLRKLLINAVINPLTALLRIRNGELPATPARLDLMKQLFDETESILRECGLDAGPHWDELLNVCERTAANRSSMLQDVLAGRETEIEAINGAIAAMAEGLGRAAPRNGQIAALVRAMTDG